jgi:hypothetical protein
MGHVETFVVINARVDVGVADLIAALSEFPTLCTLNSCEGGAFVDFRFGRTLAESAAFLCWLGRAMAGEPVSITAEWGGSASLILSLTLPPEQIKSVTNSLRKAATTFHSLLSPYGKGRTKSRNSTSHRGQSQTGPICDLPANLTDLILRDLQT